MIECFGLIPWTNLEVDFYSLHPGRNFLEILVRFASKSIHSFIVIHAQTKKQTHKQAKNLKTIRTCSVNNFKYSLTIFFVHLNYGILSKIVGIEKHVIFL